AAVDQRLAGEQRQLVEGKRPGRARRDREDDLPDLACKRVVEQPGERLGVLRAAESERACDGFGRARAEREQNRVVRDRSLLGHDEPRARIESSHPRPAQARSGALDQRLERKAPYLAGEERLGDRERPVDELLVGRQDLHVCELRRQVLQGKSRFECGDASTRDDDPSDGCMVAEASASAIRTDTERVAGNYGTVRTVALVLVLATAGSALAGSAERPWRPDVRAAKRYALHRHGVIAFAVRTPTRTWGWHAYQTFPSASLVKALLLVAYLDRPSVRSRALGSADRSLLDPMIRRSDNDAASRVLQIDRSGAVYGGAR